MNKVKSAKEFARKKHLHQFRKDCKTPYFNHLAQVVKCLEKLGISDEDILCAGWLHDTIEDTSTDYDDIYKGWGKKVADIVSTVTKDAKLPKEKQEKAYHVQLKSARWEAKVVKLGDIVSNIADLKNAPYTNEKKREQIKNKLYYFNLIKPAIILNKKKLSGLPSLEVELNESLEFYGMKKIILH